MLVEDFVNDKPIVLLPHPYVGATGHKLILADRADDQKMVDQRRFLIRKYGMM